MPRPIPIRLRYRVVVRAYENAAVGTEVVHELPYVTSTWQLRSIPFGAPGTAGVGSFTIELHTPSSRQYLTYFGLTSKLAKGQRIEGYEGQVGAGDPLVSGVITSITRNRDSYVVSGYTDLGLLADTETFPGETYHLSEARDGAYIVKRFAGANVLLFGDDFNPYTPGNYTSGAAPSGVAGTWAASTDDGLPVVMASAGTKAALVSTSLKAGTSLVLYRVTGRFFVSSGAPTSVIGSFGLFFSSSDFNNGMAVYLTANWASPNNVDLHIDLYSGGTLVGSATQAAMFTIDDLGTPWPFEIQVLQDGAEGLQQTPFTIVTVNGKQSTATLSSGAGTSVKAGLYFSQGDGTSNSVAYFNGVELRSRRVLADTASAFFTAGTISAGGARTLTTRRMAPTFLEELANAQDLSGNRLMFTPKAMKAGSETLGVLDFGAAPGLDLSASGEFVHGQDLIDVEESTPTDGFGTSVNMVAGATADGGGSIHWSNIPQMKTVGILGGQVATLSTLDFKALRSNARRVVSNISATSATAIIVRATPLARRVRLLSKIAFHAPTRGLVHQTATVVGIDFATGEGQLKFYLEQLPGGLGVEGRRITTGVARIAATYASR